MYTGFGWGNLKEREHLKDAGVDGRIILKWISGSGMWGHELDDLAQDRGRWRALVKAVMNFRAP